MPRMAPLRKMFSRPVQFGMKTGADLEQARDASRYCDLPLARLGDARKDFEQRRLAGAVAADDADDIAALDLEIDVF